MAPQFNVFRVLRLARKEVLLHTPVLAELLNPYGTHGQGFLFLKGFLEMAARRGVREPVQNFEKARWHIQVEVFAGDFGALDIVASCPGLRYLLVIENKIGASEQPEQLSRYYEWMRQQNCREPQLVFLTPTGRKANTLSSDKYKSLSYHHDVHPWLRDALARVQAPSVREVLRQYLETIEAC